MDTLPPSLVCRSFFHVGALSLLMFAVPVAAESVATNSDMQAFVAEIADPVSSTVGLARMEVPVCFRVHHAPSPMSDYLVARMNETAEFAGLGVQSPNCIPNVDIVFTEDASATARQLQREQPELLRPFGYLDNTTQGSQALNEFVRSGAPVRWWQTIVQVETNGDVALDLPQADATRSITGSGSRLRSAVRDRLLGTLVLVEIDKLGEASWDQLADYLAMVSLAQVNPRAEIARYDSILNLFEANSPALQLTALDRAYLESLYQVNRHLLPHAQQGQLISAIERRLQPGEQQLALGDK